jgi:ElaB/YqjD/DUF883 family membrane-anchored ribosome-binding protein
MDNESEVIIQQMEETRTSLQDKLETLEQQVTETVQQATETVQHATATVSETVDTVKEAVQDTVGAVKDSLDLGRQVERHPWAMLLGAALTGYVVGRLLDWRVAGASPSPAAGPRAEPHPNGSTSVPLGAFQAPPPTSPPEPSLWDEVSEKYHKELGMLKGLAVSTVAGVVREMLTASAPPPLAPQIKEIVDGITVKLGGHPVEGPILNLAPKPEAAKEEFRRMHDAAPCL